LSGLPCGWTSASLADLIAPDGIFSDGDWVESKDQDPAGEIRLLQLADIGDGVFVDKSNRFVNDSKFEQLRCTEVFEGDVLIARMPYPLGRACLAPHLRRRCITVVDVAVARPGAYSVEPKWLMHFLNAPQVRQVIEMQSSGTTRRRISRGKLAQLNLPIPPLCEQERIADKLDFLFAQVTACRSHIDRIPDILKRFRQSVLSAATTGELTREWREERSEELEWEMSSIAEIATQVFDGPFGSHLKSKDYVDSGVRVIRLENIASLRFIEEKRTYVSREKYDSLKKHTLEAGDILFSSFVDEEVRVCMLPDGLDGTAINKADCFCIRAHRVRCLPEFLLLRLAAPSTFDVLDDSVHGATRPRINLGQLRSIQFPLPTLAEQHEIVRRATVLLGFADSLERRLELVRHLLERTTPSMLAKAFRGALVPQDANDEHASELLANLRAKKANGSINRPGKRSSTSEARANSGRTVKNAKTAGSSSRRRAVSRTKS